MGFACFRTVRQMFEQHRPVTQPQEVLHTLPSSSTPRPRIVFTFPSGIHRPFEGLRCHVPQTKMAYYCPQAESAAPAPLAEEKQAVIVGSKRRNRARVPDYVKVALLEVL